MGQQKKHVSGCTPVPIFLQILLRKQTACTNVIEPCGGWHIEAIYLKGKQDLENQMSKSCDDLDKMFGLFLSRPKKISVPAMDLVLGSVASED